MNHERSLDTLSLDGGWLCLNFINTVHDRTIPDPHDYLPTYGEVLKWMRKTHTFSATETAGLETLYGKNEEEGQHAHKELISARELLHKLFAAVAHGDQPDVNVTEQYNELLSRTLPNLKIEFNHGNVAEVRWQKNIGLERPLYTIVKSAHDLLLSDKLNRVKACGCCGWLFLDKSKNHSRRWCDMQSCGSSVKAKKYYRRKKQEESKKSTGQ